MITYDYTNLLYSSKIPTGITEARILNYMHLIQKAHEEIQNDRKKDIMGFYELPEQNITRILDFVKKEKDNFDDFVVLGIGGSALGNSAIYSAIKAVKPLKNLHVCDNVDPYMLHDMLSKINIKRTLFNVITKSGTTAETMSVFMIILEILKKELGENYKKNLVITTDQEKGFLRQVVNKDNITSFIVPDNVGGRFSVLTDVGLLSSAFVGIDIERLLKGAAMIKPSCENTDIFANPAYMNGLLHYFYMTDGKNISVMMPYSNPLYLLADWYRQLWAESLGKQFNTRKQQIMVGQTPVKALGTTDQHSQVQLYVEGPNDKVTTFITVENFKHDYKIPKIYLERDEVNYLAGKKLSTLLNTERYATEIALTEAGRPNCNITLPEISEETIGQFIFMYEVQTVFTGKLLEVNPLDQPGVEAGKIATYAMMGKKGFELENKTVDKYNEFKKLNKRII
ncbi:MAG: glucose-6-phosphate isomerase [Candidatus Cloacimonetes bacterium]|nr:glucose-6-phosphate isomerase [Candidatus Cloacimonadota bacterium]